MLVGAFDSILEKFEKNCDKTAKGLSALVITPDDRSLFQDTTTELKQLVLQVNESMDLAARGLHWEQIHKHIVEWPEEVDAQSRV